MSNSKCVSFANDFELKKAICKLIMRACLCGFLFFLLNVSIIHLLTKYFQWQEWIAASLFIAFAIFDILLLVPFFLNKRMIEWIEYNKVPAEPSKITYDLNKDNTPVVKEYSNSEDCKVYISVYNNETTVWMLQNGRGQNVFHGDINLCFSEVSKYWNKCQIRFIPSCTPAEHLDLPNWKVELEYENTAVAVIN